MSFDQVVAALTEAIIHDRFLLQESEAQSSYDGVAVFVSGQGRRMPDYLRFPFKCLTLVFGLWPILSTGRPFHRLTHERRINQVRAWRQSSWGVKRDFIKFYDTFVTYAWYAERYADDE